MERSAASSAQRTLEPFGVLRRALTAGFVKLRRSSVTVGEWPVWAGSDVGPGLVATVCCTASDDSEEPKPVTRVTASDI